MPITILLQYIHSYRLLASILFPTYHLHPGWTIPVAWVIPAPMPKYWISKFHPFFCHFYCGLDRQVHLLRNCPHLHGSHSDVMEAIIPKFLTIVQPLQISPWFQQDLPAFRICHGGRRRKMCQNDPTHPKVSECPLLAPFSGGITAEGGKKSPSTEPLKGSKKPLHQTRWRGRKSPSTKPVKGLPKSHISSHSITLYQHP